jgi:hypothetical protein
MNRPMYESQNDLSNEKDVANYLADKWSCVFKKLPISYNVDWLLINNSETPKAFAELKCRNNESIKYPTLLLSLSKWMKGKELGKELNIPFIVIVRWTDGVYFHIAGKHEVTYGFGGRRDRNDAQDVEPIVLIPTDTFKKVI